jgi:hypothetical protein
MLFYLDANIVQDCADYDDFIFGSGALPSGINAKLKEELCALRKLVEIELQLEDVGFENRWDFAALRNLMKELLAGQPTENQQKVYSILTLQRRLNIDTSTFSWYLFFSTHNSTRRQRMLPACRTADETFAIPQFALTRSDIDAFMDELRGFHTAFRTCFTRQEPRDQFFHYMVGQFSTVERKSIEPIALQVEGGKVRAMQRLVSEALWDEAAMLETYQRLVQDEMGEPDGVLSIDETGFAKKGQDSVGVARQYCGALGKVENCQVGVFAAYA